MPAAPNHALQRTAPAVTLAAPPPSPAQPARQPPPSLSLGSLGDFRTLMPYYRHKTKDVIYSLTHKPDIRPDTHKGKHSGWTISGTLETTYADNPTDPVTGRLTKPTITAANSHFEAKDSQHEALADYFRLWQPPDSIEISAAEYQNLLKQYSSTH